MAKGDEQRTTLGGKHKLTLIDTIAQSVGLMGPVFSIAFLVPLVVGITAATGTGAGNAASLAVLIAAVGVVGLGWIIAEYTRKIQAAGSLYDYVTDGLGGRVGSAAGWLYYAGMIALGAGILPMIGGTIHDTIQSEFNRAPFGYFVWDVLLFLLVGTIIYLGVALSTRVQLTLALISVTVVLVFSVYVIIKSGGIHHIGEGFSVSSSPSHWKGIFFGVLYGVLLFTGFETSANLAEETESTGAKHSSRRADLGASSSASSTSSVRSPRFRGSTSIWARWARTRVHHCSHWPDLRAWVVLPAWAFDASLNWWSSST